MNILNKSSTGKLFTVQKVLALLRTYRPRLGWFSWEGKRYEPSVTLDEQVELLSLIGDIALKDGEKHSIITTTGSGVQMMYIPCFAPMNGRSKLLAYHLSNTSSTQGVLLIWDQYISDPTGFTTNGVRGSATAPVYQVQIPANADVDAEALTRPYFQTGVVGQVNTQPLLYSILLAHAALG